MTWAASTDDVGVAGYGFYVDGNLVASPSSAAYALTGLSCGTSYTVAVDAFDAAGNRSGKTTVTTSTAACADSQLPTAPVGLAATFVTQAAVTLSWGGSSDNVGVAGYDLYLGAIVAGTTAQTSYAFSGLSCGTTYTVGVDAYDPAGNRSAVSWLIVTTGACADTSPPTAPRNLVESAATVSAISAAWTASTDNVAVTGYRVYLDGTLAGTTATTSYTATGLSCGRSHQVVVDAYDAAGNRSPQTAATMATSACPAGPPGDTQPPTTPTGLAVTSAGQTMIALNWTAATDNVGIAGYGVYENGSLIASPATTGYTLIGLTCGTSYTLSVDAYDAAGNRSNDGDDHHQHHRVPRHRPAHRADQRRARDADDHQHLDHLDAVDRQRLRRRLRPLRRRLGRRNRDRDRIHLHRHSPAGRTTRLASTPTTPPATTPPRRRP